jgi:hypothetical protein
MTNNTSTPPKHTRTLAFGSYEELVAYVDGSPSEHSYSPSQLSDSHSQVDNSSVGNSTNASLLQQPSDTDTDPDSLEDTIVALELDRSTFAHLETPLVPSQTNDQYSSEAENNSTTTTPEEAYLIPHFVVTMGLSTGGSYFM